MTVCVDLKDDAATVTAVATAIAAKRGRAINVVLLVENQVLRRHGSVGASGEDVEQLELALRIQLKDRTAARVAATLVAVGVAGNFVPFRTGCRWRP